MSLSKEEAREILPFYLVSQPNACDAFDRELDEILDVLYPDEEENQDAA